MRHIFHQCVIFTISVYPYLQSVCQINHQFVMYSINVINLPWMIHFTMRPSYLPSERHIYYQCLFIHVFYHQCVIFNTINTYHQCVILTPWAQFYVHSGDEEWDSVQTPCLDLIVTLHGVVVVVQVDYPSLSRLTGVKLLPTQGVLWKTSDNLHQYQEWSDVQTLYMYMYI